jgi:peptide-N4-(N-acetyl-beta-glucosaminyl)asparagine amidase
MDEDNGDLYGHIIAGNPDSGVAYIIPATQVFDRIAKRLVAL